MVTRIGGIPRRLLGHNDCADAVTTWINSNRIYVFKGESFYRLGKVNKEPYYRFGKVNRGERNPKSIATRWMRCDGGVGTTEP